MVFFETFKTKITKMIFALRMPPGNGASIRFLSSRAESQIDFGDKTEFVSSLQPSDVSANHRNRQLDSESGRYDGLFITNTM